MGKFAEEILKLPTLSDFFQGSKSQFPGQREKQSPKAKNGGKCPITLAHFRK